MQPITEPERCLAVYLGWRVNVQASQPGQERIWCNADLRRVGVRESALLAELRKVAK